MVLIFVLDTQNRSPLFSCSTYWSSLTASCSSPIVSSSLCKWFSSNLSVYVSDDHPILDVIRLYFQCVLTKNHFIEFIRLKCLLHRHRSIRLLEPYRPRSTTISSYWIAQRLTVCPTIVSIGTFKFVPHRFHRVSFGNEVDPIFRVISPIRPIRRVISYKSNLFSTMTVGPTCV
jgi:hypothetical protein